MIKAQDKLVLRASLIIKVEIKGIMEIRDPMVRVIILIITTRVDINISKTSNIKEGRTNKTNITKISSKCIKRPDSSKPPLNSNNNNISNNRKPMFRRTNSPLSKRKKSRNFKWPLN